MEVGIVMSVAVSKFKSSLTNTLMKLQSKVDSLYPFRILSANNDKTGVVDDYETNILE